MPQKPIFARNPLLPTVQVSLSGGMIRTQDEGMIRLYDQAVRYSEYPDLWEGLFRIACLIKSDPLQEPVTCLIQKAILPTETGSFHGTLSEQVCVARAALSLFEYSTDRDILKRIASWCRYTEIEWDNLSKGDPLVFLPADLMEFLVRFYRISGLRSVLRICARLRSEAFDWTTVLQTFQQTIPLQDNQDILLSSVFSTEKDKLGYDQKQYLVNHAESIADAFRFSAYSGLFSGNRQDLTAGRTAWHFLQKHHGAICGGTSAAPLLSGSAPDKSINTDALAAWTEAFAAQASLDDSCWATDEMVRMVYNGLAYCLKKDHAPSCQQVNRCSYSPEKEENERHLYARLTRAAAAAYHHAVTLTENSIRINYLLVGKYVLNLKNHPVVLQADDQKAVFQCRDGEGVGLAVEVFFAGTETADVYVLHEGERFPVRTDSMIRTPGKYMSADRIQGDRDGIVFVQGEKILAEKTHHQGICFLVRNRLLSADIRPDAYAFAVAGLPKFAGRDIVLTASEISGWHIRNGNPDDIPVLPSMETKSVKLDLHPYADTDNRLTMFPRADQACLK